jgi:hypothetical protein
VTLLLSGCALVLGIEDGIVADDGDGTGATGGAGTGGGHAGGQNDGGGGETGPGGGSACAGVEPYVNLVALDTPFAYWGFTTPAISGQHIDFSGNGFDASETIALDLVPGLVHCDQGSAIDFKGLSDQHLFIEGSELTASELNFDGLADFSFEAWIRPRSSDTGFIFFKVNGSTSNEAGYQFGFSGSNELQFTRWSAVQPDGDLLVAAPAPEQTHHVVAVFEGNIMRIYINGTEEGSLASSLAISPSTVELQLGTHNLDAVVDEVAIYDYVLAPETIMQHHDAGRGIR